MFTTLLHFLLLATPSLAQTVTITRDIPFSGHPCVRQCLHRPYAAGTDLGDALECGPPYEEDCYCPTAAPQADIVSRHIDDCATESCSRGDVTKDIESMRYYYAGYCVENGYTAELVEEWYLSAETVSEEGASETATEEAITTTEEATTTTEGPTTTAEEATTTTEEPATSEEPSTTEEASTSEQTVESTSRSEWSLPTDVDEDDDNGRLTDNLDFEGNDPNQEDAASTFGAELLLSLVMPALVALQWM